MSNQSVPRQGTALPFRRAEWDLLVTLPGRVVVAAVVAASAQADPAHRTVAEGVAEGLAGIDAIAAGRASASRLVREVVAAIYDEPDDDLPGTDSQPDVFEACRAAARLLRERAGRVDADAYRHWLVAIATRVCHAVRTGPFGVGGAAISPVERRFLAELADALTG